MHFLSVCQPKELLPYLPGNPDRKIRSVPMAEQGSHAEVFGLSFNRKSNKVLPDTISFFFELSQKQGLISAPVGKLIFPVYFDHHCFVSALSHP